jgi:hypothetical protein
MSDIKSLANNLRKMANKSDITAAAGRTSLEKLATIALIHDQLPKENSMIKSSSKLRTALAGLGIAGLSGGAGLYGHKKGKGVGEEEGKSRLFSLAKPALEKAIRQRAIAEHVAGRIYASRRGMDKSSSSRLTRALTGITAVAAPAAAYTYGKKKGKEKGYRSGYETSREQAINRLNYENARFNRALNYIRGAQQEASSSGGKK